MFIFTHSQSDAKEVLKQASLHGKRVGEGGIAGVLLLQQKGLLGPESLQAGTVKYHKQWTVTHFLEQSIFYLEGKCKDLKEEEIKETFLMLSKYLRKPSNSFDNPGDYDVFENIAHFHFHKISAFLLFF